MQKYVKSDANWKLALPVLALASYALLLAAYVNLLSKNNADIGKLYSLLHALSIVYIAVISFIIFKEKFDKYDSRTASGPAACL